MKVNGFDTEKIIPIFMKFLEIACERTDIRKPVSWTLFQTWKVFDLNEKEKEK